MVGILSEVELLRWEGLDARVQEATPLRVAQITPGDGTILGGLPPYVEVAFNRHVDRDTLSHETFKLEGGEPSCPVRASSIDYDSGTRRARLVPDWNSMAGVIPTVYADFTVTLIGTDAGQGAITDPNKSPLDGDKTFSPGGNFTSWFRVVT